MMQQVSVSDTVLENLQQAAVSAQAWLQREKGEYYRVNDLKQAFVHWLELCLEQLAEEAMYHAFEGDRTFAVNRQDFQAQLEKLPYAMTPQDAEELEKHVA